MLLLKHVVDLRLDTILLSHLLLLLLEVLKGRILLLLVNSSEATWGTLVLFVGRLTGLANARDGSE